MSERAEDFFVVGGTMRPQAASYIRRPADDELAERLLAGEFCYVLTARQMGKSSLMVRTARRLAERGVRSVVIDLTAIGTVGADAWYLGLLSALRSQLRLSVDPAAWWAERAGQSAPQRFRAFLREIALAQLAAPLVVFVDEIDATLALPFRDDFFAALRAMFNEREAEPAFQRLTFALLGVAAPTDLIKDQSRTPFNIGRRVDLGELSLADAAPLREALERLFPGQGEQVLGRVFHWTGGHPYLTQKLCAAAAREPAAQWDDPAVDALVARDVLDERAGDENLKFVQNRVRGTPAPERRAMLRLYQRVYRGARVPDDDSSIVQNRLELTGIVAARRGALEVRNAIYRRAFDRRWVAATLPPDTQRRVAIGAALVALLLVLALLVAPRFLPQPADSLAQGYADTFEATLGSETSDSHTRRLDSLNRLFALETYRGRQLALHEFYDRLSPEQQLLLFKRADASDAARMLRVTREIAATLGADKDRADLELLDAMIAGLARLPQPAPGTSYDLQLILPAWRDGREKMIQGEYGLALDLFTRASASGGVETMPALLYDRALARARAPKPDTASALSDLDAMLTAAAQQPTPLPATPTPSALARTPLFGSSAGPPSAVAGAIATPGAGTPGSGTGGEASGEGDGFGSTPEPSPAAAPNALRDTQRFRTRERIGATVADLLANEPALREAYRAALGSGKYPQLEQTVASLPDAATPTAEAPPTIAADATAASAADAPTAAPLPGGQSLTPPPSPQPIPNVTPAAGLRPAISDVVDLLPKGKDQFPQRSISAIDTIVFRATDSGINQIGLKALESFANFNVTVRQWSGISYHFVIDRDGTIYQTNRLETVSPHSAAYNQRGIGLALITFSNYDGPRFTDAQLRSAARLTAWLLSDLRLPLSALKDRGEVSQNSSPTGLDYTSLRADIRRLLDSAKVTLPTSAPPPATSVPIRPTVPPTQLPPTAPPYPPPQLGRPTATPGAKPGG